MTGPNSEPQFMAKPPPILSLKAALELFLCTLEEVIGIICIVLTALHVQTILA